MPDHDESQEKKNRYRRMLGLSLLLIVVVIWVSANYLMRAIFVENDYDKPFFITYVNTSCFSIYAAIRFLPPLFKKCLGKLRRSTTYQELSEPSEEVQVEREPSDEAVETVEIVEEHVSEMMTQKQVARLALTFCFIWFLANWSNNASLALTNVASSTIISSTSCTIYSLPFLNGSILDTHHWIHGPHTYPLLFFTCSIFGVILVSLDGSSSSSNDWRGDVLALSGAFCYGLYITFLKKHVPDESTLDTPLFLGFVGLFNLSLLWPLFFVLSYSGLEPFQWPSLKITGAVLINAFIGTVVSDYLWLKSMLLTSPLVATVGLSLTIPLAMVGDVVFKKVSVGWMVWVGAVCVIGGFVVVNLVGSYKEWDESVDEWVWRWVDKVRGKRNVSDENEERHQSNETRPSPDVE